MRHSIDIGQVADSMRLVALLDLYKVDYNEGDCDSGNPDQKIQKMERH